MVDLLARAGARIGTDLDAAWTTSLRDYLARLSPRNPVVANSHFVKLQKATQAYFGKRCDGPGCDWAEALSKAPVIQQADHSFLLLDRETFVNNYLFAIAADLAGFERVITIQCSTVSCLSRRKPLRGSPFLNWRGTTYNIFGLSKQFYKNCAFGLIRGPVTAQFIPMDGDAAKPDEDPFLAPFLGRKWERADDAFFEMNRELWQMCKAGLRCELGIADDRLTSELIALHIEDPGSPVHRLVFDRRIRDAFLARKRELIRSPHNISINRPEPDYFWYRELGSPRLRPLMFRPGRDTIEYEKSGVSVDYPGDFAPDKIARALRNGTLFPDIVLIFIARCLLTGVDAIGGASQQDYVDLFRRMLLECDRETNLLSDDERKTVERPLPSRLGGAVLVGHGSVLDQVLQSMEPFTNLMPRISGLLNLTVGEAIGDLADASYLADKVNIT